MYKSENNIPAEAWRIQSEEITLYIYSDKLQKFSEELACLWLINGYTEKGFT